MAPAHKPRQLYSRDTVNEVPRYWRKGAILFDFGFAKYYVFAHFGVEFAKFKFFGVVAGIFLGDVEKAGSSGTFEFDFLNDGFCHNHYP